MIKIEADLVGFTPKKGSGTFDDGKAWATDHVELHVLTPLSGDGAKGYATVSHRIKDCDAHSVAAAAAVGKKISLSCEMQTKGRGDKPQLMPVSFKVI